MKRAAFYLRVSTDGQSTDNQRIVLAEVAQHRGWQVVQVYEDAGISGAAGRDKRAAFDRMLKDAARRRFDVLMVAAVDRLGRSTATVSVALADLAASGVEPYCHREGMDGTTPYGRAMLNMASVFAELERDLIRDRVKAGIARVRALPDGHAEGKKKHGRPPLPDKVRDRVRAMRAEGVPMRRIAADCGVALSTVQKVLIGEAAPPRA